MGVKRGGGSQRPKFGGAYAATQRAQGAIGETVGSGHSDREALRMCRPGVATRWFGVSDGVDGHSAAEAC